MTNIMIWLDRVSNFFPSRKGVRNCIMSKQEHSQKSCINLNLILSLKNASQMSIHVIST